MSNSQVPSLVKSPWPLVSSHSPFIWLSRSNGISACHRKSLLLFFFFFFFFYAQQSSLPLPLSLSLSPGRFSSLLTMHHLVHRFQRSHFVTFATNRFAFFCLMAQSLLSRFSNQWSTSYLNCARAFTLSSTDEQCALETCHLACPWGPENERAASEQHCVSPVITW